MKARTSLEGSGLLHSLCGMFSEPSFPEKGVQRIC